MKFDVARLYKRTKLLIKYAYIILIGHVVDLLLVAGPKKVNRKEILLAGNSVKNNDADVVFLGGIDLQNVANEEDSFKKKADEVFGSDTVTFGHFRNSDIETWAGIYNANLLDDTIVKINDVNLGFIVLDLDKLVADKNIIFKIVKKVKNLKKNGAGSVVAYVSGNPKVENPGKIKKDIGMLGVDYVIGTDDHIKRKKNFRTYSFTGTRVAYSLGCITRTSTSRKVKSHYGVAIKVLFRNIDKNAEIVTEGYIPLYTSFENGKLVNFEELKKDEVRGNKKKEKIYIYISKVLRGFRNNRELIRMCDIFNVLEVSIPEKYKYLEDFSVNEICARISETAPGNVYFYRQAYDYNERLKTDPNFNFHTKKYVRKAIFRQCTFIFSHMELPSFVPHIVLDDVRDAHIKVMQWYRKQFLDTKYIVVTGSTGKTSTKEMIYNALSAGFSNVERSLKNDNIQPKMGANMQKISFNCNLFVQEVGGGIPEGASRHSRMVLPQAAVVTNVGTAHINNFNSQEALMENKLGIIDGMGKDGVLFLNADDPLLATAKVDCNVCYFALENKDADYYADNIRTVGAETHFDIMGKNGCCVPAKINVLGEYNVLNAVCAYAIGKHFGMEDAKILKGIFKFKTSGSRQNLIKLGGYTVFADCYNASASSMATALNVISQLTPKEGGKRIAVIGDVTGVGDWQEYVNKEIAAAIDAHELETVICYGQHANSIAGMLQNKDKEIVCFNEKERDKVEEWLEANVTTKDVIGFKGSSKLFIDEIIDSVFGVALSDATKLEGGLFTKVKKNGYSQLVFDNYVSLCKYYGKKKDIVIKDKDFGKDVKIIYARTFDGNTYLETIRLGKYVTRIGDSAFANCTNLKKVVLSPNLKYIGADAFANCTSLKEILIPNSVKYVSKNAFSGCNAEIKYVDMNE